MASMKIEWRDDILDGNDFTGKAPFYMYVNPENRETRRVENFSGGDGMQALEDLKAELEALRGVVAGKAEKAVYSAAEVDTGAKWVDGKPIYRRVLQGTTGAVNVAVTVGTMSGAAKVVSLCGMIAAGSVSVPANANFTDFVLSAWARTNGEVAVSHNNASYAGKPCFIVVEYTKV